MSNWIYVGKGSWGTTPSWARKVMGKIQRACATQIPSDVTKRDACNGNGCENCAGVCPAYLKAKDENEST